MSIFYSPTYWNNLRTEMFAQDPLDNFIKEGLNESEQELLWTSDHYWFVADNYDWDGRITYILEGILSVCGFDTDYYGAPVLIQVWELIPDYLERFWDFHQYIDRTSPTCKFELMHVILTSKSAMITENHLTYSILLRKSCFFSLDTGFVTKKTHEDKSYGQVVSTCNAKLLIAQQIIKKSPINNLFADLI